MDTRMPTLSKCLFLYRFHSYIFNFPKYKSTKSPIFFCSNNATETKSTMMKSISNGSYKHKSLFAVADSGLILRDAYWAIAQHNQTILKRTYEALWAMPHRIRKSATKITAILRIINELPDFLKTVGPAFWPVMISRLGLVFCLILVLHVRLDIKSNSAFSLSID